MYFFLDKFRSKVRPGSLFVLLWLLLCSLVLSACGEQNKVYDVGLYLDSPFSSPKVEGLKEGLKALGYNEGETIQYHLLDATKTPADQLPATLQQFVSQNYPVYWTDTNEGAADLQGVGLSTKPIIVAGLTNPVQSGLVKAYYETATNINGVDSLNSELTVTRLNLLLTFDPSIRTVYLLYDTTNRADTTYLPVIRAEATKLGVALIEKPIKSKAESSQILSQLTAGEAKAILSMSDSVFEDMLDLNLLKTVVIREKLVLVGLNRAETDFGALFSYGSDFKEVGRQSAGYVDRVLHGISPTALPLLQPSQLKWVLNQNSAQQIGRKFNDEDLTSADEVIK